MKKAHTVEGNDDMGKKHTTKMDDLYKEDGKADHYNKGFIETIVQIERLYGTLPAAMFCEMNAFKYRSRLGHKKTEDIETELKKIRWYEKKCSELRAKNMTSDKIEWKSHQQ